MVLPIPASLGAHRAPPSLVLTLLAMLDAATASADRGKWTEAVDWGFTEPTTQALANPVHLVLLPGDGNPYHSRLLWWDSGIKLGATTFFCGREMGWRTGSDGCDQFPSASFDTIGVRGTPEAGMNVYCAGHVGLADGRLLTAGGTSWLTGIYGDNGSRIFTPGTGTAPGSWSDPGNTHDWRWYPTTTMLRDGRVLLNSGYGPRHHRIFGGRRNGAPPSSPSGDSIFRYAPGEGGRWEGGVYPDPDPLGAGRPRVREGHTGVEMRGIPGFDAQVYFGGRDSIGGPLNDTWFQTRSNNTTGLHYGYRWARPNVGQLLPPPRSGHSAVVALGNMMVVFGGLGENGVSLNDAWRLYRNPQGQLVWEPMVVSGSVPLPRFGHAAVYDTATIVIGGVPTSVRRMIVFGGASAPGEVIPDTSIYELRIDPQNPGSGTWHAMIQGYFPGLYQSNARPAPRFHYSLSMDLRKPPYPFGGRYNAAVLYGGQTAAGYSDSLWILWIMPDSLRWQLKAALPGSAPPGPRARHTTPLDMGQSGRIYVYGGENGSGAADASIYVSVKSPYDGEVNWTRWGSSEVGMSGHTAVLDGEATLSRRPDLFDPAAPSGQKWSSMVGSPLLQPTYPLNFIVPGAGNGVARVLGVSIDNTTYRLDVPPEGSVPPWQILPNGNLGLFPRTGVTHRPGHIMVTEAGGSGRTKVLDAGSLSNAWRDSGTMVPRDNHNLVLLPDGKVLAIGGMSGNTPVRRPQIWNPATGTWTDTTSADRLPMLLYSRGYHSTAILLPDGRVMSAGSPDSRLFNLFCPFYLFKSDGVTLASRPVIQDAPTSVTWGSTFTICVPDTAGIRRVCLVRPGATTHAFDENQRYVPLRFTAAGGPPRLLATAPASPDSAPPGYYLLFIIGSIDGTDTLPDVPSIARWVRVGPAGRDTCDVTPGLPMNSIGLDVSTPKSLYLYWTATGDDDSLVASGSAARFDLRRSSAAITDDSVWESAVESQDESIPGLAGTPGAGSFTELQSCTEYYVAVRSIDDNLNASRYPGLRRFRTMGRACANRRYAVTGERAGGVSVGTALAEGPMVVETRREGARAWSVVVHRVTSLLAEQSRAETLVLQDADGAGGWRTRRRIVVGPADDVIGLGIAEDERRAVLPRGYALDQVPARLGTGGRVLVEARHSRHGGLAPERTATSPVALASGDSLVLKYEHDGAAAALAGVAEGLLVARRRGEPISPSPYADRSIPQRFALHQNQPNPFAASTAIEFELPTAVAARLEVFDLFGRRIRVVLDRICPPGYHSVTWDRRDARGRGVGSGIYVYRLTAGSFRQQRKMLLIP